MLDYDICRETNKVLEGHYLIAYIIALGLLHICE